MESFDVSLVSVGTWLGFLRWAFLAAMAIWTFYLIDKQVQARKINLGIVALVATIIMTPVLVLDVVWKNPSKDEAVVVPDTSNVTPNPYGVPEQSEQSSDSTSYKPVVPINNNYSERNSGGSSSDSTPAPSPTPEPTYREVDISGASIDGSEKDGKYEVGKTVKITANEKEGHHFAKWFSNNDAINNKIDNPLEFVMPDDNLLIYPVYEKDQYTVTFVLDNGEQNPTETVEHNGTATRPQTDPTKTDYTFDNWYVAADGDTLYDFTAQITADTSIYAHWTPSISYVCKPAFPGTLHQSILKGTINEVTYGTIADFDADPAAGNAYDCDVNDDDYYDPIYERFYYLKTEDDKAILLSYAYTNTSGVYDNQKIATTNNSMDSLMPTTSVWSNSDITIRIPKRDDFVPACQSAVEDLMYDNSLLSCNYVLERTANYADDGVWGSGSNDKYPSAYWLQNEGSSTYRAHSYKFYVYDGGTSNGVKPVIEVPIDLIEVRRQKSAIITFDAQGGDAINSMSVSVHDPVGTLPSTQKTDNVFVGWFTDPEHGTQITAGSYIREDTVLYAHWALDVPYNVSFDYQDGTTPVVYSLKIGDALGTLPSKTRINYKLFGWYMDTSYHTEITPDTTVPGEITYYARWISDTQEFPIVFSEVNACTFNGNSLSGDYCTADKTKGYIDTGIKLFSETDNNYAKDFEIGFDIVTYDANDQTESQATLVSSKAENLPYSPGFVFRRYKDSTKIEYTERYSFDNDYKKQADAESSALQRVRVRRINGVMYYSWNDEEFVQKRDISANTTHFDAPVWFGASIKSDWTALNPTSQRSLRGTLTDMYIRLGTYSDP